MKLVVGAPGRAFLMLMGLSTFGIGLLPNPDHGLSSARRCTGIGCGCAAQLPITRTARRDRHYPLAREYFLEKQAPYQGHEALKNDAQLNACCWEKKGPCSAITRGAPQYKSRAQDCDSNACQRNLIRADPNRGPHKVSSCWSLTLIRF